MSSFIFPSGSKRVDIFATKKVAQDNADSTFESDSPAFDAIKDIPEVKEKAGLILDEVKEKVQEVAQEIVEKVVDKVVGKIEEVKSEECAPCAATATEEKPAESVEVAVDGKEVKEEAPAEEVEIEIGEENGEEPEEVEIEIADEADEKCEEGKEECEEKEEGKEDEEAGPEDIFKKGKEAEASSKSNFIRIAKLSPKNKTALREYWLALGFPKDYVDAMVKDY